MDEKKLVKYRLLVEYTVPESARLTADAEAAQREEIRETYDGPLGVLVGINLLNVEFGTVSDEAAS